MIVAPGHLQGGLRAALRRTKTDLDREGRKKGDAPATGWAEDSISVQMSLRHRYYAPGGAANAASLDSGVSLISMLRIEGDDLRRLLQQYGVTTDTVQVSDRANVGRASPHGERHMLVRYDEGIDMPLDKAEKSQEGLIGDHLT